MLAITARMLCQLLVRAQVGAGLLRLMQQAS